MYVRISLYGCDDTTYIDTDVTVEEYDFLRKLKRLSKENSSYVCQPTLDVERKESKMTNEKIGVLLVDVPEPRLWRHSFLAEGIA
ncbi:TPA: hypothetical protein U1317_002185, partial [Streptococcus suis]|nr:hypothetical protein [Streptococcus suis]HEM5178866.1 hypothetical protein [Streptococcus suis]